MGFFNESAIQTEPPVSDVPKCGACGLLKSCSSPKMPVAGEGRKSILVVGEAPGDDEDRQGRPFTGKTGQRLRSELRRLGVDLDRDCWATNAAICCPPGNAKPNDKQIDYCRPNVLRALRELRPRAVLLLGQAAIRSVIGHLWRSAPGSADRWAGWRIPAGAIGARVCPTWHPSHVEREEAPALDLWWRRHLAGAVEATSLPRPEPRDFGAEVDVIVEPRRAAARIERMLREPGPVAVDFETNMLKPDSAAADLVSCAFCWRGRETISFPWLGEAAEAAEALLRSKRHPKIAANRKMEQRWFRRFCGGWIERLEWDTVDAAHWLDNREGITSVKFQAFVLLGAPDYNSTVEPYLKDSAGSNEPNRIRELDLEVLLRYGGVDALVEYEIAKIQREALKG